MHKYMALNILYISIYMMKRSLGCMLHKKLELKSSSSAPIQFTILGITLNGKKTRNNMK